MATIKRTFAFKDAKVSVNNFDTNGKAKLELTGLQTLNYIININQEAIYGSGSKPKFINKGNEDYSGSVSMLQADYDNLLLMAGVNMKEFNEATQIVAVLDKGDTSNPFKTIVTCSNVALNPSGATYSQGDLSASIDVPFICIDIKQEVTQNGTTKIIDTSKE